MPPEQTHAESPSALARRLRPGIVVAAETIDRERALPTDLVDELARAGFFRLLAPASVGGGEIDLVEFLAAVLELARADASTAWCVAQAAVFATHAGSMPEALAREVLGEPTAIIANGPLARAEVQPADGGYRLTGRWNFSSGSRHSTWFTAIAPLDGDDEIRMFLLPKSDVELIDVWQVNGLRGTGSFSFEAVDAFVPASRIWNPKTAPREPGPLYVIPQVLLFAASFASVALGVSRTALNDAIEFAGGNRARLERDLRRDKPVVWRDVGRAEAIWGSARAFLNEAVGELWSGAQRSRSLTVDQRIRLRLASTHATRLAADVTDIAYEICGSNAVFEANPVQRRFQDVHAITQQIQARLAHYDTAGQYYLGLEPNGLF